MPQQLRINIPVTLPNELSTSPCCHLAKPLYFFVSNKRLLTSFGIYTYLLSTWATLWYFSHCFTYLVTEWRSYTNKLECSQSTLIWRPGNPMTLVCECRKNNSRKTQKFLLWHQHKKKQQSINNNNSITHPNGDKYFIHRSINHGQSIKHHVRRRPSPNAA